jgi:hypothetical protein
VERLPTVLFAWLSMVMMMFDALQTVFLDRKHGAFDTLDARRGSAGRLRYRPDALTVLQGLLDLT